VTGSTIRDPIRIARDDPARNWHVLDGSQPGKDLRIDCDVVIVGSGAGGGISAEVLVRAGLRVVMIEEGPFKSSSDFRMREREAYPQLYQESAGRQTRDKGITILQGRNVGGSTTVNWTSSFRTPEATLAYWVKEFGLDEYATDRLAPWFEHVEARLGIERWPQHPNANNDVLRRGCEKLGIASNAMKRNVRGCWNLGYCGMGCPTNAKQSMLVTTIPAALDGGMTLLHSTRVERIAHRFDRATSLSARGMIGVAAEGRRFSIRAKHFVLAGGAINNPGLMLRSQFPDPYERLGKRTFLHPSTVSAALFPEEINGYAGAPQTVYSDHFLGIAPIDGPVGFKLEAPPIHPVLAGITLQGFGHDHAAWMKRLPNLQVLIALLRDGFHTGSPGGRVAIRNDGSPVLDYPLSDFLWEGARRSLLAMAEIQFAAGARQVMPLHEDAVPCRSWPEAKKLIEGLPMAILRTRLASAHVMGGCGMGTDPRHAVIAGDGRHHQFDNVWVFDGSAFPTSIGANPQVSIYAMATRNATQLADQMTGKPRQAVA